MRRRDFLATAGAALWPADGRAEPFAPRYRHPSPYETLLPYIDPTKDVFSGEVAAAALEARLRRMFEGKEALPPRLREWSSKLKAVRSARFFVLPGDRVRFEIATGRGYHTGVWKTPDFETISQDAVSLPAPLFTDVTSHVFGHVRSFEEQLLRGNLWWRAQLDSAAGIDVFGNQGIAVGDIDNDGVDEVYVCQPGGLPNRLYRFGPGGSAEDITERSGLDILDDTTSALFVDLRNLGRQDLIVLRASGPLLFLNRGDGRFDELPDAFRFRTRPQGSFTGMAAADYDRDGRVDLYLCSYVYFQSEDQYQYPSPYHDATNGPPNFLFRNRLTERGGAFEDVTEESGIAENNNRFSFAAAWCDFDGDGWPDLYVANDFGRNNLYRNRGGKFRDEAAKAGVEDMGPGMSASWFDYDGDGRPDLYVSNMWTAAGQRVVRDPEFHPAVGFEEAYRRHTKGNSLYRNRGDGTFEETGAAEGVEMGRWAWGSGGFDFDHDGVPEILVATGMVTSDFGQGEPTRDLESFFWRQVVAKTSEEYENGWNALNQLIRQDYGWHGGERNVFYVRKDGRYRDWSGVSGLDFAEDSRAFALTDFDGDGHPDLLLKSRLGPQVRALRNDAGAGQPVIAVRLIGSKSNRDGIGARVEVNGSVQWVAAGSGFLSQHTKTLYFGMNGRERGDVKITWPSGGVQELTGLAAGFTYIVTEGTAETSRTAFRERMQHSSSPVAGINRPEFREGWLLEGVPTPDRRKGPGFLVLHAGARPVAHAGVPLEALDLSRDADLGAVYSLLHRYIFEYRSALDLPATLLIDEASRLRKVYAGVPDANTMRKDLRVLDGAPRALPFPGRYYATPHRNYFKLGAAFYWAGYSEHALPYLEEVVRTKPDNWKAFLAIGRIQQEAGKLREALVSYQRVIAIKPDYAGAYVNASESLASLKDIPSAKKMIEAAPDSPEAANQLGMLYASAGEYADARKQFERAIAARRDYSGAINNLGVLYAKIGQAKDAIAAFRYGIEVAPNDEMLYLNLGRVYVMMGDRNGAREALSRLLAHKPGSEVATKALAELDSR
jgi:tetratricopeptide (TPR) repeat protein